MIPPAFIDELLARTDIVEIIEPKVALKKSGPKLFWPLSFSSRKVAQFFSQSRKAVLLLFWLSGLRFGPEVFDGI
jgi:DNA primase